MSRFGRVHGSLIAGIIICCLVAFGCDCDKPTEPRPDELVDYPVYFWDAESTHKLFVYHPADLTVDSFDVDPDPERGLTVSADGTLLYLANWTSITVVTADSLRFVAELLYPTTGPVQVSPDNNLVAIFGDSLVILRTSDYQVVFRDTTDVSRGQFTDDSQALYCVGYPPNYYALLIGLGETDTTIVRKAFPNGFPIWVAPADNGAKLLAYLRMADFFYRFVVWDMAADSEVFVEDIYPGDGEIVTAPGWPYAVYTNHGRLIGPPGESAFKLFNIGANQIAMTVSTQDAIADSMPHFFPVGSSVVTPDHRWLVMLNAIGPSQVLLYDLRNRRYIDWINLGYNKFFGNAATQLQK